MEAIFKYFSSRNNPRPEPYNYFAAPDGEDVHRKINYMIKSTGYIGVPLSTWFSVCLHPKVPVTYIHMAKYFAYITCPIIAGGCIFTWTSNFLGKVKENYLTVEEIKKRNTYDKAVSSAWNWGLGAALGSLTTYTWTKSLGYIFLIATCAGLTAAGIRYADILDYKLLLSDERVCCNTVIIHNFTLTEDRKRNWTTEAPKTKQ